MRFVICVCFNTIIIFKNKQKNQQVDDGANNVRHKRAGKKFGVFGGIAEMGRLTYEQYKDTTSTFQKILDLLNDSFSDTAKNRVSKKQLYDLTILQFSLFQPATESPDTDTDSNATTTERYRISRKELGSILNKNFRGLQKLLRIELNDAWNVSSLSNLIIILFNI